MALRYKAKVKEQNPSAHPRLRVRYDRAAGSAHNVTAGDLIVWFELGMLLFGAALLASTLIRLIIGSLTTDLAIFIGILGTILANALLILAGVVPTVARRFLASRRGDLQGKGGNP